MQMIEMRHFDLISPVIGMDEDTFREYRWLQIIGVNEYIQNRSTVILGQDNKTQKEPNINVCIFGSFCILYVKYTLCP